MRVSSKKVPSVGFVSLGCPKALVDTEKLVTRLRVEGYEVASDYASSDLVVVNTCAFIDAAVAESLDAISEAMKENGRVLVIGCLGGKKDVDGGNWLVERFPDLVGVVGPDQVDKAMDLIRKALPAKLHRNDSLDTPAGIKLTPSHYAYLKISEGCSHKCTFCIIPDLRGPLVSRPIGDVMREAQNLVESGVRELLVISQDTAAYGLQDGVCGNAPRENALSGIGRGTVAPELLGALSLRVPVSERRCGLAFDGGRENPSVPGCAVSACSPPNSESHETTGKRRTQS